MSKAMYVQKGDAIDYLNSTDAVIGAGDVVVIGNHIGVAGCDIAAGEVGSLYITGVFEFAKKAGEEIAVGDDVSYTAADGMAKPAAAGGGEAGASEGAEASEGEKTSKASKAAAKAADAAVAAGFAIAASAADETTVRVKIG